MVYSIAGIKSVNFSGKDGGEIKGLSLYLASPISPEKGNGLEVEKFFVSSKRVEELSSNLLVGSEVDVVFNRYGKIEDISDVK